MAPTCRAQRWCSLTSVPRCSSTSTWPACRRGSPSGVLPISPSANSSVSSLSSTSPTLSNWSATFISPSVSLQALRRLSTNSSAGDSYSSATSTTSIRTWPMQTMSSPICATSTSSTTSAFSPMNSENCYATSSAISQRSTRQNSSSASCASGVTWQTSTMTSTVASPTRASPTKAPSTVRSSPLNSHLSPLTPPTTTISSSASTCCRRWNNNSSPNCRKLAKPTSTGTSTTITCKATRPVTISPSTCVISPTN